MDHTVTDVCHRLAGAMVSTKIEQNVQHNAKLFCLAVLRAPAQCYFSAAAPASRKWIWWTKTLERDQPKVKTRKALTRGLTDALAMLFLLW